MDCCCCARQVVVVELPFLRPCWRPKIWRKASAAWSSYPMVCATTWPNSSVISGWWNAISSTLLTTPPKSTGINSSFQSLPSRRTVTRVIFRDLNGLFWPTRWSELPVSTLGLEAPKSINPSMTCQEAIDMMKKERFNQLPVSETDGYSV